MNSTVTCGSCNHVLDEDPGIQSEARPPCPLCGSTSRRISVKAEAVSASTVLAHATVNFGVLAGSNLLLQAVVIKGRKTDEGHIIESIAPAWFEIARLVRDDPSIMFQIDWRKWEEMVAGIYERAGFDEVILTPRSGDLGRDVIAVKRGIITVRFVDSVKAFQPGRLVTANDVRALLGVVAADPKASKGVVTTTSEFAPRIEEDDLIKPFIPYRLELVNGQELIRRLAELS